MAGKQGRGELGLHPDGASHSALALNGPGHVDEHFQIGVPVIGHEGLVSPATTSTQETSTTVPSVLFRTKDVSTQIAVRGLGQSSHRSRPPLIVSLTTSACGNVVAVTVSLCALDHA